MSLSTKSWKFKALIFLLLPILTFSQELTVGNVYPGEIAVGGFEISQKTTLQLKGNGATFKNNNWHDLVFYAWILDSKTRECIWHLEDDYDFEEEKELFEIDEQLTLPAGKYEVYYAGSDYYKDNNNNIGTIISNFFSKSKRDYKRKYKSELNINVSGSDIRVLEGVTLADSFAKNAVVSFNRVGDDEYLEKGFSLKADTKLKIYSIGEGTRNEVYDYGWIYDVKNNKVVWRAKPRRAMSAGGGEKNYLVDEEIELSAGSYMAYYVTDDSHSFDEWNVMPPDDPQFWGLTIWAASEIDHANVIPFIESDIVHPVVKINKVRDDKFLSQGFSLSESMELRILALGEGHNKKRLVDHGWIVDADTKELVWKMNGNRKLEHAGGGSKNLMVDEVEYFDKGNYIAHYTSDDSHAFDEWNTTPPFNYVRWGITVWPTNNDERSSITLFDADSYKSENTIVEILRVRINKEYNKSFSLDEDAKIRIYSMGEGDRSEMYDYAWIEDQRGKIVWEMTYRKTDHAGGASKNRVYNDTIMLEAGEFTVYYETDGSHSYNSWNSTPPPNPENYGITISYEK